jgi:hypothetical protein
MTSAILSAEAGFYAGLPDQAVGWASVAGDHVTFDGVGIPGAHTTRLSVRSTDLAARMPADTMVYAEARDVGTGVHNLVSWIKTTFADQLPADTLTQVETFLGAKLEDELSFVQDVGIGGSYSNGKLHVGLAATVTDEALAKQRVQTLTGAVRTLAAFGGGSDAITVTDSSVAGATVTTIDFSGMLKSNGGTGSVAQQLPIDSSISVAVANGQLLLGTGDFVSQALQRQSGDSLAGNQRYSSAITSAGTPNGGLFYADLAAIKTAIETAGKAGSDYLTNTKPYLDPLDRLVTVFNDTGDTVTQRMQLFVTKH